MESIQSVLDEINKLIEEIKNCKACARRKAFLKRQLKKLQRGQKDVQTP